MSTDVVITMDVTGSMSPVISVVRKRVSEMLSKLVGSISDLRVAIVVHGDYCDSERVRFQYIDFTNDLTALQNFVSHASNTGGGDSDEFYEYVLNRVRFFNWQADTKIVMMIGDANPHDVGYRYDRERYDLNWRTEARSLSDMGVKIYPVQALGSRHSQTFYKELALIGAGKRVELDQFSDAVETIIAISMHSNGNLAAYKTELEGSFTMNRSLAKLFRDLDADLGVSEVYTRKDSSGLIPVPPSRFQVLMVERDTAIKNFVEANGARFRIGRGFYQLMKTEMIQERKEVVLRNKITGDMFTGDEARNFIGLPYGTRGNVKKTFSDEYDVFVQSTSPNRKLIGGYKFLYEAEID